MLVIQNTQNPDEFWSNDDGWTERDGAEEFKESETALVNLPMDGQWVNSATGRTYRIQRFYKEAGKESETIDTGLTLDDAKAHCASSDSSGDGWFDGFEMEG